VILLPCPWCGMRSAQEFRYVGEAKVRPDPNAATPEEWRDYLYGLSNPADWTVESWFHRAGCRRYFTVERHAVTNEVRSSRPPAAQQVGGEAR
jgi:sarcosine oxidase subunit delta